MSLASDPLELYNHLLTLQKKSNYYGAIGITTLILAFILFSIVNDLQKTEKLFENDNWLSLVGFLACIPFGIVILRRYRDVLPTQRKAIFFNFYKTSERLKKFIEMQGPEEKRNARSSLKGLYFIVVKWYRAEAPDPISEVPRSIVNSINDKIIPLLNTEKMDLLSQVLRCFQDHRDIIFQREPTFNDWKNFSEKLESIQDVNQMTIDSKKELNKGKRFLKHVGWVVLFLVIGATVGFVVRLLGGSLDTQIMAGVAFTAALIAAYFGKYLLVLRPQSS
ncbi:MAG: hypothetical protein ACRD9Q_04950 [Nitrososphaeraceae archaeon]